MALAGAVLAACHGTQEAPPPQAAPPAAANAEAAAQVFAAVVRRVEPVAEAVCAAQAPGRDCDFAISVDPDRRQPPNAYQSLDARGRPQIVFTLSLIAGAQNADELAFVLGHEAAHHIAAHLARAERQAITGAILGGILASAGGAGAEGVDLGLRLGAQVGALRFSKAHELEADRLGTVIAYRAGYDPVRGAAFFARLPDPGDRFLGSHPANADRQAAVRDTAAGLAGL